MNENVLNKLKILAESDNTMSLARPVALYVPTTAGMLGNTVGGWGICHSFAEDGRCISLLKVMLTNYCIYDCAYCINRRSNDLPRANSFRQRTCGLDNGVLPPQLYCPVFFLSSGWCAILDYMMERLVRVAKDLRLSIVSTVISI